MKKILFSSLFLSIFIIACSNNKADTKNYDDVAPTVLSISSEKAEWNQDNNTYTKDVTLQVAQPEVYPVSVSLCLLQNPTGDADNITGAITPMEFERLGFETQSCTSIDYEFDNDTAQTLNFNILEAIKNLEGDQYIEGDIYVSLLVEGEFEQIYILGKETIIKPTPEVVPKYGFHSSTIIDNDTKWSIQDNIFPEYIEATAEIDFKIQGDTADTIKIYAGDTAGSLEGQADVLGLDGEVKGNISYTLTSNILEPTQIKANIEDNNENILDSVDFTNHATTDANILPDVSALVKIRIPYDDIKPFLQTIADDKTYLQPSNIYTNEIPVKFTVVAEKDGVEYESANKTVTVDFGDLIYDVRDYYESIFTSEYMKGHTEGTINQAFSPLKYEAPKNLSSGNSKFNINANVKAGLYIEEDSAKKQQQMRSRVSADGKLTLIGKQIDAFSGYVEAIGIPNSSVDANDGEASLEIDLSIFGKKVLSNKNTGAPTNYKVSYDKLSFEKDFEQTDTITLVVPFYYKVGGRGAIGFTPSATISYTQGSFSNKVNVTEVKEITNPTAKPEETVVDAETIPEVSRYMHEYNYDELPLWAQTFVTEEGIERNGSIVNDYNNKLLIEYKKRIRYNNAIEGYQTEIPALITSMQEVTEKPLGVQVVFKGEPYASLSGYGEGGFGIAKDWKLVRFGVGIGVEAKLDPIIDVRAPVTLGGFIGMGNSPVDNNNYIYLNYNFNAPLNYTLLKGKVWAGLHLNLQIKIFKWINIVNSQYGPTLFDNSGQKANTINLIQPVNNNHMVKIKGNTL